MPILFFILLFPLIDIIFSMWLISAYSWALYVLLFTSVLGIMMLRQHRLVIIQTLIRRLHQGKLAALFWIARYYVAALLFVFPGVLSDLLAIVFLLPWRGKMARPVSPDEVIEAEFTRAENTLSSPSTHPSSVSSKQQDKT